MRKGVLPLSKLYRGLLHMLFLLLLIEGMSWLGLKAIDIAMPSTEILPKTDEIYAKQSLYIEQLLESQRGEKKSVLILDADLGWRYRENFNSSLNGINRQGVRSNREYTNTVTSGVTRIAVFGDSFAYGSEVSNADAWSTQAESIFPDLEVLNYSVPGFGTDQAYLRYLRDGQALAPQIVIIGFAPINLRRAVNVYRRFLSINELPLVKPRFILNEQGDLELIETPYRAASDYQHLLEKPQLLKELGQYDYWYSPAVYNNPLYDWSATIRLITNIAIIFHRKVLDPDRLLLRGSASGEQIFNDQSLAFRIQSKLLEKFYNTVKETEAIPVIMFFPGKDDISRARSGISTTYSPLAKFLSAHNLKYIDSIEAFIDLPGDPDVAQLFAPGGHYSERANKIIAEFVGKKISELKDVSTAETGTFYNNLERSRRACSANQKFTDYASHI